MALAESESMGYVDNIKPESQSQQPLQDESMKVDPNNAANSFNKQSSILSLTLDEIQLKSGKSFGSMNMDEFLANLWSVDENQVPPQPMLQNEPTNYTNGIADQPTLQRQASLSVPATLCNKTVDEVWFEIQKEHNPNNVCRVRGPPQRAQTLGELTLEEFLVQAGIVQGVPMSSQQGMVTAIQSNNNGNNTTCLDANFQMGHVLGIGFSAHPNLNGFATYQTFSQNKMFGGESSSNGTANENCHHSLMDSNGQKSKKRIIEGPLEIVVERRQRRMIKNRESAARSRARKQAYTVELELELNLLKEENAKLKQVVEEIEQKRKQEVMNKKKTTMAQKKAFKLRTMRRTLSLS